MKFTINKGDLRSILAKVQGLTGRKTNLSITENVLIQAIDSGVKLIATDLETGFEGTYSATVETEGLIAINARKFHEIVRDFPKDAINIDEDEKWIKIGNENVEYHIMGMNPEDFPDSPKVADVLFFEADSGSLKRMIEKNVIISGATDDKRPHINGVFLEKIEEENLLRMVSTDGSRLSIVEYSFEEGDASAFEGGVIIPKKGLAEVMKFLDNTGTVYMGLKENHLVIKKDAETITIRLLEGDFPRYQDIIVKDSANNEIKLERRTLLMMLKRMSILSSENYKGVVFKFDKNILQISVTNPDLGEAKEETPITFDGEPIEAAFNPKFFIDTLNVIDDDNAVLNIVNAERPCLVEGESDKSFLSVIMPMRI